MSKNEQDRVDATAFLAFEYSRSVNDNTWLGYTTSSLDPFIQINSPALLRSRKVALVYIFQYAPSRVDPAGCGQ